MPATTCGKAHLNVQEELVVELFGLDGFLHAALAVVKAGAPAVIQEHDADLPCRVGLERLLDGDEILERL